MKIALIALHFAEYAARLAVELSSEHTVQLHLSAPNAAREIPTALLHQLGSSVDVHLHRHPARKYAAIDGPRLARALRRFRPDVVHVQEAAEWTALSAWALGPRAPLVVTVHDPLSHSGQDAAQRRRTLWASARLRRASNAIIVHGQSIVTEMIAAEPRVEGHTHSVMHGILGELPSERIQRKDDTLLFFGRIEAYKGLGVLLQAVCLLNGRGVPHRLTIAGRGSDLDNHRALIATLPNVTLHERYIPPDEVAPLFAECAAAVIPYLDATQSGVAAQAFSTGTPVIASRVGALPDVVDDGFNGLLVPAGDANALADALELVLKKKEFAALLAAGATATAANRLSWRSIARETLAVYESVIVTGKPASRRLSFRVIQ